MAEYSRKEIKRMLRDKCVPHDAPKWVFDELEKMRKQMNREIPPPKEEIHKYLTELYSAHPIINLKSLKGRLIIGLRKLRAPSWVVKFKAMIEEWTDYF